MNYSRREFMSFSLASMGIAASQMHILSGCSASARFPLSSDESTASIRLHQNENPFGPSPLAIAAIPDFLKSTGTYAESDSLKEKLGEILGVDTDMLAIGLGSFEILQLIPVTFGEKGGNIISPKETLILAAKYAEAVGIEIQWIPLTKDWRFDLESMLDAVNSRTRAVYLTNPNNPTGNWMEYSDLQYLLDHIPESVLLMVDEAYIQFAPGGSKNGIDLIKEGRSNVVVTRTFSKAYGLAGLRVGYAVGSSKKIDEIKKKMHYECLSLSSIGLPAAQAALEDTDHILKTVANARASRAFFESQLTANKLEYIVGDTPFILIKLGENTPTFQSEMRARKILVANGAGCNMPEYIRVSYGLEHQNQTFIEHLSSIINNIRIVPS